MYTCIHTYYIYIYIYICFAPRAGPPAVEIQILYEQLEYEAVFEYCSVAFGEAVYSVK